MQVTESIILESGSPIRSRDRQAPDSLWERIGLLKPEEQLLLELTLRAGASQRQIGRLLNMPPWRVGRWQRRVGKRLHDPVVISLLDPACPLEPAYRQIGVEHLLVDLSVADLAKKHGMTAERLRRIVHSIELWHRGARHGGREPVSRGRTNREVAINELAGRKSVSRALADSQRANRESANRTPANREVTNREAGGRASANGRYVAAGST